MLEIISDIDRAAFLFINQTLSNPVTDFLMPIVTSDWVLRAIYGLSILLILVMGNRRLRWMALFSILALALTDSISAGIIKPMIERLRPCHAIESVHLLVGCGSGYAMPSTHAANAFGQALFFGLLVGRLRWYLVGFATLVALSRVFVGVHYRADIIAGSLLGGMIGYWAARLYGRLERKFRW